MRTKQLILGVVLTAMLASLQPFRASATEISDRQARVRQQRLGQSSLRFNYSQQNYFLRKSTAKAKCVQLGQARCMGKTRANSQVQPSKFTPPNTQPDYLSPYLRGVYKYGVSNYKTSGFME